MATNSYVLFAVEFPFPERAALDFMFLCKGNFDDYPQWFVNKFQLTENNFNSFITKICSWNGYLGVTTNYNRGELYIASEENGDIHGVAYMLSQVMEHYKIKKAVVIEAALTYNKPKPYEFGGIVVVIGPDRCEFKSTYECGQELVEEMGLEEVGQ